MYQDADDDPKLTAYALGELDAAEREAIEKRLESDEAARRYVEEVRGTAEQLTGELKQESVPGLDDKRKAAIEAILTPSASPLPDRRPYPAAPRRARGIWVASGMAAAAAILLVGWLITPYSKSYMKLEPGELRIADSRHDDLDSMGNERLARRSDMKYEESLRTFSKVLKSSAERDPFALYQKRKPVPGMPALIPPDPAPPASPVDVPETPQHDTNTFAPIIENPFQFVTDTPLSTFSIDVDTGSYSLIRQFLNTGRMPPPGAVRIEEMINYFTYDYTPPQDETPFRANVEIATCPWNADHRLARIGIKGREIPINERPSSNLVFLLDVSGSMNQPNKLPYVRRGMQMLVDKLVENDRVSIVVYAGASGVVLPSTPCANKPAIRAALNKLTADGSTHGSAGIKLAYKVASGNLIKGGVNRVILCTDGDFNVGVTNRSELIRLIEEKARGGVFLSVLGFGMGNYKDATLEQLADKGNGNYAYIDTLMEAQKVLVDELSSTLVTIAKDVKIQIEFNPDKVGAYRLIGYENRLLKKEDFNDDTKDAGEIGAGHTVTALYELVPKGKEINLPGVDKLTYQGERKLTEEAKRNEAFKLMIRYKQPDGDTSTKLEFRITDIGKRFSQTTKDFRFASSVAAFGMLLRKSKYAKRMTYDFVIETAGEARGTDRFGYRKEFLELVRKAKKLHH